MRIIEGKDAAAYLAILPGAKPDTPVHLLGVGNVQGTDSGEYRVVLQDPDTKQPLDRFDVTADYVEKTLMEKDTTIINCHQVRYKTTEGMDTITLVPPPTE
jgi:hypothetical protein